MGVFAIADTGIKTADEQISASKRRENIQQYLLVSPLRSSLSSPQLQVRTALFTLKFKIVWSTTRLDVYLQRTLYIVFRWHGFGSCAAGLLVFERLEPGLNANDALSDDSPVALVRIGYFVSSILIGNGVRRSAFAANGSQHHGSPR
jgi:hypothetical protein